MSYQVRRAEYYTTVADEPGQALKLLTLLAEKGIGLLAFTAVPVGPNRTQLTLFPDDVAKTVSEAGRGPAAAGRALRRAAGPGTGRARRPGGGACEAL
jgi:hypothetical protein